MLSLHSPQPPSNALSTLPRDGPLHFLRGCRGWLQSRYYNSAQTCRNALDSAWFQCHHRPPLLHSQRPFRRLLGASGCSTEGGIALLHHFSFCTQSWVYDIKVEEAPALTGRGYRFAIGGDNSPACQSAAIERIEGRATVCQYQSMAPSETVESRHTTFPWYLWCSILAITSGMVGAHWDISWHRSIGRDTFLTPAHIAIYLCGVLAAISCGYLILATTFGKVEELRGATVRMWGFRGPLGAFLAAWGGVAMLTSAPFDDWWHNAYGLDVKIISPPHSVLAVGIFMVGVGALILALGFMNRAEGESRRRMEWVFVYLSGLMLVNAFTFTMEYSGRTIMHSAIFYRVFALSAPLFLAAFARASGRRWAATEMAAVYMLFWAGGNWILQMFPAEPKLGPVYYQVTHFVPSNFPVLLIVPALCLDWILSQTKAYETWQRGVVSGAVIVVSLIAVQWPFANFLMSPYSRNWFFHTNNFDYLARSTSYQMRNLFFAFEKSAGDFWMGLGIAILTGMITATMGMYAGGWMARVKR